MVTLDATCSMARPWVGINWPLHLRRLAIPLRPATWRLRVSWWTHILVAAGIGLFSSGLAALVALVLLVDALTVPACEAATPAAPKFGVAPFAFDPEARAKAFVHAMANDEFRTAYEMLAPEQWGAESLCAYSLEGFWRTLTASEARLTLVHVSDRPKFAPMYNRLEVPLRLTLESAEGQREVYVQVNLLSDARITGYEVDHAMTEVGEVQVYPPPPYAELDAFEESDVSVGQAPWELGGVLTIPHGSGPFPAAVLLGGGDRDGTGATTKLTRDLAWGMASKGVATVRIDRRTSAHALAAARQPVFTIDEELVDDALAAIELLRRTPRIDPARIYIFGGSHGGFAAPRVAQRDPNVAGLIIANSPSGKLSDFIWRHVRHKARLDGEVTENEERYIRATDAQAAALNAWLSGREVPLDISVHRGFYGHLGMYSPAAVASDLPIRLFILAVEWDRIVPPEDAETWIEQLRPRRHVAFRLYRGHNHALRDVSNLTEPDPMPGGHMSRQVVADIAAWIHDEWTDRWCADQAAWYAGCRGGLSPTG